MFYVTSIFIGYLIRYPLCKISLVKGKNTSSNCEFDAVFFAIGGEISLDILITESQQNS